MAARRLFLLLTMLVTTVVVPASAQQFLHGAGACFLQRPVYERMSGLAPNDQPPDLRSGKDRTAFADFCAAIGPQQGFYSKDWEMGIAGAGFSFPAVIGPIEYLYDMRKDMTTEEFRCWAHMAVDALNLALEGIPEERVRYQPASRIRIAALARRRAAAVRCG